MAPIAVPLDEENATSLTSNGVATSLAKTAPSVLKSAPSATGNELKSSLMTDNITEGLKSVPPIRAIPSETLPELDASRLITTFTTAPRSVPAPGSPEEASQRVCTDHMVTVQWTSKTGWSAPHLKPYGPLSLMPTASCLHYATECFEGMKLYRGYDGKLRLFRPNLNCARMLMSSNRIALPSFQPTELLKLITELCATDGPKWLPADRPGSFLYIRPTMIASDPALGVQRPKEATLFVILTCFPSMDLDPSGMKLLASQSDTVRAWPGGFGYAKVGANYGPSLVAQGEARQLGFDQILWLFGGNGEVTEAGASNFFVVWKTKEGRLQLVTAPLGDKIILDGVTRRSVLELVRKRLASGPDAIEVVERKFRIDELEEAVREGRLVEAFAAGTAFFIAPVSLIHYRGKDLRVPMEVGKGGKYTHTVKTWLKDIMWGNVQNEWGYVVEEKK